MPPFDPRELCIGTGKHNCVGGKPDHCVAVGETDPGQYGVQLTQIALTIDEDFISLDAFLSDFRDGASVIGRIVISRSRSRISMISISTSHSRSRPRRCA